MPVGMGSLVGGFVLAGTLRLWGLSLVVEQTIADR